MTHTVVAGAAALVMAAGLLTAAPDARLPEADRTPVHPSTQAGPPPATDVPTSARTATSSRYRPPLASPVLLARFVAPVRRWGPGHRGIDLAVSTGQDVLAPADGTVTFSGVVVDRGVLTLEHPDGLRSSLEPVEAGLPVGTAVRAGDRVATVDSGGHCGSRCLHWGVRRGSTYLDPLDLLPGSGPVVLLPRGP